MLKDIGGAGQTEKMRERKKEFNKCWLICHEAVYEGIKAKIIEVE